MIRIGLVGESPYDTKAIKHLLQQKYDRGFHYTTLLKKITGDHLNTPKALRAIGSEVREHKPDLVIVIRDADALETNKSVVDKKRAWYNSLSKQIDKKSLLLLNIYELEALILADIESLNAHYQTTVNFKGNVSYQEKPKEYLQNKTGHKYKESQCPELFQHLDFKTVRNNCAYFKAFISDFEKEIKN